jgi:hypothetical protein
MGYFLYAYVVEAEADNKGVALKTTVLGSGEYGKKGLFFWSEGERPPGLFSFAGGTLHCTSDLQAVPGYPITGRHGDAPGENENLIQIHEDFRPPSPVDPVIFHFVLPARFVPCPNRAPLVTPPLPSVIVRGDRLSATFVATGPADIRFWIRRLEPKERLADFDLNKLFAKPAERSAKATFEINLGVIKFALGDK